MVCARYVGCKGSFKGTARCPNNISEHFIKLPHIDSDVDHNRFSLIPQINDDSLMRAKTTKS